MRKEKFKFSEGKKISINWLCSLRYLSLLMSVRSFSNSCDFDRLALSRAEHGVEGKLKFVDKIDSGGP